MGDHRKRRRGARRSTDGRGREYDGRRAAVRPAPAMGGGLPASQSAEPGGDLSSRDLRPPDKLARPATVRSSRLSLTAPVRVLSARTLVGGGSDHRPRRRGGTSPELTGRSGQGARRSRRASHVPSSGRSACDLESWPASARRGFPGGRTSEDRPRRVLSSFRKADGANRG